VRDSAGRPVRGARAFVWGTAAATSADADGTFTLGGLPAGTHTLEVRAIGFTMRRMPVDLAAGRAGAVDVRLERVANLDPVTVFGTPSKPSAPSTRLAEFLERRGHNPFGRYLTGEEIAIRNPVVLTDAFRSIPGLQVVRDDRLGNAIVGRGQRGPCKAVVIVDGVALQSDDVIDLFVSPQGVAGIEVYLNATDAPPQYGGGRLTGCSVVLIWTR
jgi:hypothetical protein